MAFGDHVQSRSVDAGSTTSSSLAFLSNNTAGNTLIIGVRYSNTGTGFGISDTLGNTFVHIGSNFDGSPSVNELKVYYVPDCLGGANTVTVTTTVARTVRWVISEYEGECLLDRQAYASANNTAGNSGNTATTTVANELLVSFIEINNTAALTQGTDYTKRQEIPASPNTKIGLEDRKVTSTGAYAGTWTLGTSGWWGCHIATFSEVAPPAVDRRISPIILAHAISRAAYF